jgi:putative two-component system response regulator
MTTIDLARAPTDRQLLVVDDEEPIRRVLARILTRAGYGCSTAANVSEARRLLAEKRFDLVLSDVMMPDESGFSLLAHVRETHPDTAVIMVTAVDDPRAAEPVAKNGAYGYLIKPFEPSAILINVAAALHRRDEALAERLRNTELANTITSAEKELEDALDRLYVASAAWTASQEETVDRLAQAAEWRDSTTGQHLQNMSVHVARLARALDMPAEHAEHLRIASKMHDVGKIALPDNVLLKRGKFTAEERAIMQEHSEIGARMLEGSDSALLRLAAEVALTHHEHFDGGGYPRGLAGTDIPLEGRIVAVADVYDALRSERPYKSAYSLEQSVEILLGERGTLLDPELVDVFVEALGDDD